MSRMVNPDRRSRNGVSAFTLIELLVVVAIIAILISILLPALNGVRKSAKASVCGSNQRSVGQAVHIYLAENNATFPASYLYASDWEGNYNMADQGLNASTFGYIHWSWFLFNRGQVQDEAFECPEILNGGVPRTNPGPQARFWELGQQVDDSGSSTPNAGSREDKQVPRLAFAANAAVMPRNKFNGNAGPRRNRWVSETELQSSRGVILASEFHQDWATAAVNEGSSLKSKSHRPINPFYHIGSGTNEYSSPALGFIYGDETQGDPFYGLEPLTQIRNIPGLIDGARGPETNAIGRHHPGGDQLGGTTNFLFVDGSVKRTTVLSTLRNREWGEKYFSVTGENEVLPDTPR